MPAADIASRSGRAVATETVARLLELGATVHQEVREQGPDFVTASVVDPFGNILGVMYNQHYLDQLTSGGDDKWS